MSASQRSFSCCGCESKITYPLTLHCGHIICFNCADALRSEIHQQQQEYSAMCPQCKATTHTNDIRLLLPQGYENLEQQENQEGGDEGEEKKEQGEEDYIVAVAEGDNGNDDDDFEFQQIPEDEDNLELREYEGTWDNGGQQQGMQEQQPGQLLQMQQLFQEDQMAQQYSHQISQEQQQNQLNQEVNAPMNMNKQNLGKAAGGRETSAQSIPQGDKRLDKNNNSNDNTVNTRQLVQSKSSSSVSMTVNNNNSNKKPSQRSIAKQNTGRDSANGIHNAASNGQQQQLITPHYYPQHAKNNANRFKASNNHNQILRAGANAAGSNISNTNNAGLGNAPHAAAEPLIEKMLSSRVVRNSSNSNNKKSLLSNSSSYQNNRRGSSNAAASSVNQLGNNQNSSQMNQRFQIQTKNGNSISNSVNHNYVLSQSNNSNFDNGNWINQQDGVMGMDPEIDNDFQEQDQLQAGVLVDHGNERNQDQENILNNNNLRADDNHIYADSNNNNINHNPSWQSSSLTDSDNLLEKGLLCKEHNEPVQLYCQEEKELLCVSCLYNSDRHKRHRVAPLKRSLELIRKENNLFKLEATQKLQLINSSFQICSDNRQLLQQSYNPLADLISEQFEQLHVALQNREQQLQNELKQMFTQRLVEYDQILNDLNYLKQCITEYKDCDKYNNNNSNNLNNTGANSNNSNTVNPAQGTNVVVYIFSIYSMIRSTLKNIDFSFKPLSQQHLNSLLEFKQQPLLGQIQSLGAITSKLNIREQNTTHNNIAHPNNPGGSAGNGYVHDKTKQQNYQQQQLYQQMKTNTQSQVAMKPNSQISSVQAQQHSQQQQSNYSLPSPQNQVNNSKSQRNPAYLQEKTQQQHSQLPPQHKAGSISRNPTPERTSQDDKLTPRQSIASPVTLTQNPSNTNTNSAEFNQNIQSSQLSSQQNVQQFSPVPVQQPEQHQRQNPLTHRASNTTNNNNAHNSQGCLPNELSTYAQLIVNRSTKFSTKKQQSKQDGQHAKDAQPKCSTPPQNRRINELVKNMQNVTYYALLEEKYNKRSKSSQKKEQGLK